MRPAILVLLCVLRLGVTPAVAREKPQEVTVPAGPYQLHGCYWTPDGPGPYAVMIFNHGSEKNPAPCGPPELAYFYQKKGFAFFTFQRHGHGASLGDYIMDLQKQAYMSHPMDRNAGHRAAVVLQDLYNKDTQPPVLSLKNQKWVDSQRT